MDKVRSVGENSGKEEALRNFLSDFRAFLVTTFFDGFLRDHPSLLQTATTLLEGSWNEGIGRFDINLDQFLYWIGYNSTDYKKGEFLDRIRMFLSGSPYINFRSVMAVEVPDLRVRERTDRVLIGESVEPMEPGKSVASLASDILDGMRKVLVDLQYQGLRLEMHTINAIVEGCRKHFFLNRWSPNVVHGGKRGGFYLSRADIAGTVIGYVRNSFYPHESYSTVCRTVFEYLSGHPWVLSVR